MYRLVTRLVTKPRPGAITADTTVCLYTSAHLCKACTEVYSVCVLQTSVCGLGLRYWWAGVCYSQTHVPSKRNPVDSVYLHQLA